jgi:DNA primase catalytic subunit
VGKTNDEPLLTPEIIRAYYESATVDLSLLSNANFRHFRFRLADGSFYKVPRKIRVWSDLKRQFLNKLPLDVYYSTACWLNPHKLGSRTEGKILENVIISCDLVFDIDVNGEEIQDLEQARQQAISLKNLLVSKAFDVRYLAFSGSKGFHVVSNDPWIDEKRFEDPVKREKDAIEKRKQIVNEAKAQGLFFDEKVTIDTRRIIRLPGTVNSKTGLVCTVLSDSQAKLGMDKIFKLAIPNNIIAPRIPRIGENDQGRLLRRPTKSMGEKGGRLGVRPPLKNEVYFSSFMTSNIPRTQLKVPILEIGKWKNVEAVSRIVADVQARYSIGDIYLFDDQDRWIAFSIKAVSRRRVEKILFSVGSLNLNACRKYGCTYFRVGSSIGLDGDVIKPAPKLVRILQSDMRGQVSRPHFEFLSSMGIKVRANENRLCGPGKDMLELIHSVME